MQPMEKTKWDRGWKKRDFLLYGSTYSCVCLQYAVWSDIIVCTMGPICETKKAVREQARGKTTNRLKMKESADWLSAAAAASTITTSGVKIANLIRFIIIA